MKHMTAIAAFLVASAAHGAQTNGTVESVRFDTAVTPPVCRFSQSLQKEEALFRVGLRTMPEGFLVVGALVLGTDELGLSTNEAASLTPLVADAYSRIYADMAFSNVTSALPYCFSAMKPTSGHYFLYRPQAMPEAPTCIVFLHGYGGNFLFYTWVLKEEFPDAVILAPSWGISWHRGSAAYLRDMLADAERRTGVHLRKPWLMGISAGGCGGFQIYSQSASDFAGYVCIAGAPDVAAIDSLRKDMRIVMLNGTADTMFPVSLAEERVRLAKRRLPTLRYKEVNGDHFFLLSNRKTTFDTIRDFMGTEALARPSKPK